MFSQHYDLLEEYNGNMVSTENGAGSLGLFVLLWSTVTKSLAKFKLLTAGHCQNSFLNLLTQGSRLFTDVLFNILEHKTLNILPCSNSSVFLFSRYVGSFVMALPMMFLCT